MQIIIAVIILVLIALGLIWVVERDNSLEKPLFDASILKSLQWSR